jgi:cell division septum initiation protein DivIVA
MRSSAGRPAVSDAVPGNAVGPGRPAAPDPLDRRRPNVSGDIRTVLEAGPMFRRAVLGYDCFQVDTYVQWAEDELTSARRGREDVLASYARLSADLDESRRLLVHSGGAREALGLSYRLGSLLATAADQADGMRAEAEAERAAASAEARRVVATASAEADRVLDEAAAEAERMLAEAAAQSERMVAEADRVVAEAEQTEREARAEADARLEKVRALERRASEEAEQMRQEAARDASAARLQARDEVIRMLASGREQRRRTEEEAAATRERLDREHATRRTALQVEIHELQQRLAMAGANLDHRSDPVTRSIADPTDPVPIATADEQLVAVPAPRDGGRRMAGLLHLGRRRHS